MSNCGCDNNNGCLPDISPELNCGAMLEVPIDQINCQTTPPTVPSQSNSVSFYVAPSGFIVPNVGQNGSLIVPNASYFTAGQWIQFVNPTGTFRVASVNTTSNVLGLTNAASDGATAITGNPAIGYQYPAGSRFVTVSQPSQLTATQFSALVQQSLSSLASICLDAIPSKGTGESVNILSYVRTTQCGTTGCCLRKQDFLYIGTDGVLNYTGAIVADRFSVPVPTGGVVSTNPQVNKNSGTGGGYLMPFVNPSTGVTEYVNLFSGVKNDSAYFFFLNSQGRLSLASGTLEKVYEVPKIVHDSLTVTGTSNTYSGLSSTLFDLADVIDEAVPAWVNAVSVSIQTNGNTNTNGRIEFWFNDIQVAQHVFAANGFVGYSEINKIIKLSTDKKFRLEIKAFRDYAAVTGSTTKSVVFDAGGFSGANAPLGFVKVVVNSLKLVTW